MFKYINKQGVESDQGFIVQFVGRFEVEYREDAGVISIYVEPDYTPSQEFCLQIDSDAFTHWIDGASVPFEKQSEIISNFKAAMRFQNIKIIFNQ